MLGTVLIVLVIHGVKLVTVLIKEERDRIRDLEDRVLKLEGLAQSPGNKSP